VVGALPGHASGITVIATVYNRGGQLRSWVESLARVADLEGPQAFRVCLADFGSVDVNVREVMRGAGIPHQVIDMEGEFSETDGLNACLASVTSPTEIVFTTVNTFFISRTLSPRAQPSPPFPLPVLGC